MSSNTTLEVGQAAPDFKLKGPGGQPVTLSEYRGNRNVLLVFYPLAFSPGCAHQLPEVQKELPRIQRLDTEVLGISVDSWYANDAFAKRLNLGFTLLSDFDRSTSAAYGVLLADKGYSNRALFVVDKQGRLAWSEIAPSPAEIPSTERALAAIARLA